MFLKKIMLSVLTISALFAGKIQAADSDKLIGQITKKQGKDFLAGFGLGVTHGFTNRFLIVNYTDSLSSSPKKIEIYPHFFTFMAANKLENTYNRQKHNNATLWGRGIGQCLAESIFIKQDIRDNKSLRFSMRLNFPLMSAFMNWVNNQ